MDYFIDSWDVECIRYEEDERFPEMDDLGETLILIQKPVSGKDEVLISEETMLKNFAEKFKETDFII